MNQLQIVEQIQAPVLSLNFVELEAQATEIAKSYTSIAITDDTYMAAKADAKTLAGYVNDIEKKRKEIKKQAEAPIKAFDAECKRIEQILVDAKTAIEGVTSQYDENRREERKKKIQEYLDKQLKKSGLRPEYASRITEPAGAQNLSATLKSVKENYDAQIEALMQEQQNFDNLMIIANTMVNAENEKISQKMDVSMFESDITRILQTPDISAADMSNEITAIIRQKGSSILEAEERIRQQAVEAERERLARQEQMRQEQEQQEEAMSLQEAGPEVTEEIPEIQAQPAPAMAPVPSVNEASPFATNPFVHNSEPKWEGTIRLTGTATNLGVIINAMQQLCKENNVTIEVLDSKEV